MSSLETVLNKAFPVNYFVREPERGAVVLALITLGITLLYRPLGTSAGAHFSFVITMVSYAAFAGAAAWASFRMIHWLRGEEATEPWTIQSEVISIVFTLVNMGTAVFLGAFLLEESADRWNWATFSDSLQTTALLAGIPLVGATLLNIRALTRPDPVYALDAVTIPPGTRISITAPHRDDEVTFLAEDLLYAESEGNYVHLYLNPSTEQGTVVQKETLRLTLGNLEEQLKPYPVFMRTHRAFIVNLRKVREASGNTLGLELKVAGTDAEIPVSRTNVKAFKSRFRAG